MGDCYSANPAAWQINEEALAKFVESGQASLEKYKRAVTRVPLPLKFDDNAQVSERP